MKTASARRSRASHNGNGKSQHGDRHDAPASGSQGAPSMLVQFAADRARDAADTLYEHAKERIDRAQHAMSDVRLDGSWDRMQPMLVSAAGFVRHYPLRTAMILALLGGALWLTRVDDVKS